MRFATIAIALITLALVLPACSPSINQAAKADVDQQIASLPQGTQVYEAPSSYEAMPLAVGQWTKHKMVDEDGKPSFMTYKVVGEEDGYYWIEFEQLSYYGKNVTLMLASLGDRRNPDTADIRRILSRTDDGPVDEQPPMMFGMMKSLLSNLAINWQDLPQESMTAPAGQFASCYKQRTTVSFIGFSRTSDTWAHSAVPLSGAVKSVGVDKPFTMELVAFGLTGATSSIDF